MYSKSLFLRHIVYRYHFLLFCTIAALSGCGLELLHLSHGLLLGTLLISVLIGSILADLRWADVLRHGRSSVMVLFIAIVVTALFAAGAA